MLLQLLFHLRWQGGGGTGSSAQIFPFYPWPCYDLSTVFSLQQSALELCKPMLFLLLAVCSLQAHAVYLQLFLLFLFDQLTIVFYVAVAVAGEGSFRSV